VRDRTQVQQRMRREPIRIHPSPLPGATQ
jgi:hypothetical protein